MRPELRRRDLQHLWHPYTPIADFERSDFPIIARGQGPWLYDVDGRAWLDGIASWWCVNLGHSHRRLVEAIRQQAGELQHSILGGRSHPQAIELADRLAQVTPEGLDHAMFAGDGASAVEAALKIALQYWAHAGEPKRHRFIALEDGYHGDTLGAVGVGYVPAFHQHFEPAIRPAFRARSPNCAECPCGPGGESCDLSCFESMRELVAEHHAEIAAVIVEPLCQGAAGVRIYPEAYVQQLRALCDQFGLLLIADEIAVGFGRTGAMFACDRAGIAPDIITLGKGLTGGYLPMSAALVTDRIYDAFRGRPGTPRTFYHGHTFCGNPITAAVALATLAAYEEERIIAQLPDRIAQLDVGVRRLSAPLAGSPVLSLGLIAKVHVNADAGGAERAAHIARRAAELGLLIRPLGAAVYLWPPLNLTAEELAQMLDILTAAVHDTA